MCNHPVLVRPSSRGLPVKVRSHRAETRRQRLPRQPTVDAARDVVRDCRRLAAAGDCGDVDQDVPQPVLPVGRNCRGVRLGEVDSERLHGPVGPQPRRLPQAHPNRVGATVSQDRRRVPCRGRASAGAGRHEGRALANLDMPPGLRVAARVVVAPSDRHRRGGHRRPWCDHERGRGRGGRECRQRRPRRVRGVRALGADLPLHVALAGVGDGAALCRGARQRRPRAGPDDAMLERVSGLRGRVHRVVYPRQCDRAIEGHRDAIGGQQRRGGREAEQRDRVRVRRPCGVARAGHDSPHPVLMRDHRVRGRVGERPSGRRPNEGRAVLDLIGRLDVGVVHPRHDDVSRAVLGCSHRRWRVRAHVDRARQRASRDADVVHAVHAVVVGPVRARAVSERRGRARHRADCRPSVLAGEAVDPGLVPPRRRHISRCRTNPRHINAGVRDIGSGD